MQVHFRNLFVALIAVAVAFTTGRAQTPEDKTLAPYFVVLTLWLVFVPTVARTVPTCGLYR